MMIPILRWSLVRVLLTLWALAALISMLFVRKASSYSLLGPTWDSINPLRYCVSTSYGNDYYRWLDALYYWNQTDTDFSYQTTCTNNTVELLDASYSGVTWDGMFDFDVNPDGSFRAGWGYLNYYYIQNYDAYKANSVSGHEVGHTLGLGEDPSDGPKLMNRCTCCAATSPETSRYCGYGVWTPQTDDVNGVNAMY